MTNIMFTLFTDSTPCSKRIELAPDGAVDKTNKVLGVGATQARLTFPPGQFASLLDGLTPRHALAFGVAPEGAPPNVITKDQAKTGVQGTTRTKDTFAWPLGGGVLMLDYDPGLGAEPWTGEQLRNALYRVCPEARAACHVWRPSTGSCIYADNGNEIVGVSGQRLYLMVTDASDIPRAGAVLHKQAWLAGTGRIEVSKAGRLLERGPFDISVWQAQGLDYCGGAECGPGLVQKLPLAQQLGEPTALLDTLAALPDLTAEEETRYEGLVSDAKAVMKPEADEQRERHVLTLSASMPEGAARKALEEGVLGPEFVLHHRKGVVTVAEVMADRERWGGYIYLDPLEPEYREDYSLAGVLFRDTGETSIRSKAHGEYTLMLPRWREGQDVGQAFVGGGVPPQPIDNTVVQLTAVALQKPTEDNLALSFAALHQSEYAYLYDIGRWHRWDGTRWREDADGSIFEAIRTMMRRYNNTGSRALAKFSLVQIIERSVRTSPLLARSAVEFDRDNYLLNTPGGTYDLCTGELRPHNPEDRITKLAMVGPGDSDGVRFRQFMDEITLSDVELQRFLQRALGACLSGAIEEHWLMFWIGRGRNGKNTLGDMVAEVMGDYARNIPSSTLMAQRNPPHATEIMSLKGSRMCVSSEVEEGAHWAESKIKELTGDTMLKGHLMRCDWVEFPRTHKHLIYGNYSPQLRNVDTALKSRLRIVPFNACFEGEQCDPDLPAKLRAEAGYILAWLIEGHRQWLAAGKRMGTCEAVERESADYFSAQATPDMWLTERCDVVGDDGRPNSAWPAIGDMYGDYRLWKQRRGEELVDQQRFTDWLKRHAERRRARNGTVYVGVVLRELAPDNAISGAFKK